MVRSKTAARVGLIGGSLLTMSVSLAMPTAAHAGFFDQLFGAPPPVSQPSYEYAPQQPQEPFVIDRRRAAKKAVVVDEKPVLQKTTDLMHDKTLRPGDAVMMKGGIHVYAGREMSTHRPSEFVALDDARRVKPSERIALAAMDVNRNDPLAKAAAPDTVASGRSAAVGTPVVAGVTFTDQRGKTIRYVGP